jgi:hypothetical protein
MSADKPKVTAHQPKTKFSFDETQPLKSGYLYKQGDRLKLMKKRFFVLYPNFLIYYKDLEKWQYDQTVGGLGVSTYDKLLDNSVVKGLNLPCP